MKLKRMISLITAMLMILATFAGCTEADTLDGDFATILQALSHDADAEVVKQNEDGEYEIILPISGDTVRVYERYNDFMPYVTYELVKKAEEKVTEDISKYSGGSGFYLSTDVDGYLLLSVEIIKNLPEEEWSYDIGCYDHKHLFFSERISSKSLENHVYKG